MTAAADDDAAAARRRDRHADELAAVPLTNDEIASLIMRSGAVDRIRAAGNTVDGHRATAAVVAMVRALIGYGVRG